MSLAVIVEDLLGLSYIYRPIMSDNLVNEKLVAWDISVAKMKVLT